MAGAPTRSGEAAVAGAADAVERILTGRYSCRAFLPDPVRSETIRRILRMAQRTATWCNVQPWHTFVISGAALESLRAAFHAHASNGAPAEPDFQHPKQYVGVYLERRRRTGFGLYGALGIAREDRAARDLQMLENYRFFGAPHLALVTVDLTLGDYAAIDSGAYVANFLTAAKACGVDTIAQAAVARYATFLRSHLGLPEHRRIVCGISFGFGDQKHPANAFRTERADLDEAVTWIK